MTHQIGRRELLTAGASMLALAGTKASSAGDFMPSFEFQNWTYQSFLILPTPKQLAEPPGIAVDCKKWAIGKLLLSDSPDGYIAAGFLTFAPGVELSVQVKGQVGKDGAPATFEAIGIGEKGVTKGAIYELNGWVFPGQDGKTESVRGSVRAVRGPDTSPQVELGKMPVGTVGAFMITKSAQ
jgi:hypothetical protein